MPGGQVFQAMANLLLPSCSHAVLLSTQGVLFVTAEARIRLGVWAVLGQQAVQDVARHAADLLQLCDRALDLALGNARLGSGLG